jgi:VWFA-related protein
MLPRSLIFSFIVFLIAPLAGKSLAAPQQSHLVRVNAVVYDQADKPLADLRQQDFTVLEMGREQAITKFLTPKTPLKILLLVDVSISMAEIMKPLSEALMDFVVSLGSYDEVSIISFSSKVSLEADFTFGVDRIRAVLATLEPTRDPRDATKLYDGVAIAIERLAEQKNTRTALIVVTDGEDRGSREAKRDETIELAGQSFTTVYSIYATRRASRKNDYLERLTAATGGEVYPTDKTLDKNLGDLAKLLQHHYVLGYTSSNPSDEKDPLPLEVRVSRENAKVTATKSYRVFSKK